ncbi:hypothetical protein JNJ66_06705 [Candidatus Saccharibacteria bacterium]|nr:hypothetical protein [Candidatus Saccharibacteria bacterium]
MARSAPRKRKYGSKVSGGNHHYHIPELEKLLKELERWEEITAIRLGPFKQLSRVGRRNKRLKVAGAQVSTPDGGVKDAPSLSAAEDVYVAAAKGSAPRRRGGGGLNFRATRMAMKGEIETGILCQLRAGTISQEITLHGPDLDKLKQRLRQAGYGGDW